MTRALVLCEFGSLNGGERSLLAALDGVLAAGFEVCVAAPGQGALAAELQQRNVPLAPFDVRTGDSAAQLATRRSLLAELLRGQRPDLVHANSLAMSRLSGPVARELQLASIGHLRDIMRVTPAAARDLSHHRRLLAVSHAVRNWYREQGLPAERLHVAYNGVDVEQFRPRLPTGYLAAELGLPRHTAFALSVGQIILRKGLDVLLSAAEIVVSQGADVHFVIAGSRLSAKPETVAHEQDLLRRAAQPPLAGRVHLLGLRSDMERLLAEATLLVHAARQEPLGRVLLEAAAAGVAVVATRVGGTTEIFPEADQAAWIVPPDSPTDLAAAVRQALADGPLRAQTALRARRIIEERFTAQQAARNLADHYHAALDR